LAEAQPGGKGCFPKELSPVTSLPVTIRAADLIDSVADALQFISYYHPMDYIRALGEAYDAEQSPAAKDAIAQILTNSRMCAEGHRPICQDTGIVNVFVKWGMDCRLDDNSRSMQEVIDEGVRRAYLHPENKLRASCSPTPPSPAATPATTRPACCMSKWCRARPYRSTSQPRAAAAKTSRSSR
jgi:tartrate dehydratase alpha subunit/fumarate hydratase class I-like protein